ncbi:unnamed protein product [Closterium sp. Naga37s-1]|nr:unnamed protein product [Closterium sp. Naga37s-1]
MPSRLRAAPGMRRITRSPARARARAAAAAAAAAAGSRMAKGGSTATAAAAAAAAVYFRGASGAAEAAAAAAGALGAWDGRRFIYNLDCIHSTHSALRIRRAVPSTRYVTDARNQNEAQAPPLTPSPPTAQPSPAPASAPSPAPAAKTAPEAAPAPAPAPALSASAEAAAPAVAASAVSASPRFPVRAGHALRDGVLQQRGATGGGGGGDEERMAVLRHAPWRTGPYTLSPREARGDLCRLKALFRPSPLHFLFLVRAPRRSRFARPHGARGVLSRFKVQIRSPTWGTWWGPDSNGSWSGFILAGNKTRPSASDFFRVERAPGLAPNQLRLVTLSGEFVRAGSTTYGVMDTTPSRSDPSTIFSIEPRGSFRLRLVTLSGEFVRAGPPNPPGPPPMASWITGTEPSRTNTYRSITSTEASRTNTYNNFRALLNDDGTVRVLVEGLHYWSIADNGTLVATSMDPQPNGWSNFTFVFNPTSSYSLALILAPNGKYLLPSSSGLLIAALDPQLLPSASRWESAAVFKVELVRQQCGCGGWGGKAGGKGECEGDLRPPDRRPGPSTAAFGLSLGVCSRV